MRKGSKHTKKAIALISKNNGRGNLGREFSASTRKKMSEAQLGKKHSPETLQLLKKRAQEKWENPEFVKKVLKHRRSKEFRKKISKMGKSNIGRVRPQNERDNISKTMKKVASTPEYRKKVSEGVKKSWTDSKIREKRLKGMSLSHKFKDTSIELIMKGLLDSLGVNYVQQHHIKGVTFVDFYVPSKKLIIECDGCYWHGCSIHSPGAYPDQVKRDKEQTAKLESLGYTVLRFWEHDLKNMKVIHLP